MAINPYQASFQAADNAWSAELKRLFGKHSGDVRYTKKGKGTPDSVLRALWELRELQRQLWEVHAEHISEA